MSLPILIPIDGIGIHTCLRNKVLQVRVLYRASSECSAAVAHRFWEARVAGSIPATPIDNHHLLKYDCLIREAPVRMVVA